MSGVYGAAWRRLRAAGYEVISPIEGWPKEFQEQEESSPDGSVAWLSRADVVSIVRRNTEDVIASDGTALLDNWQGSKGTRNEIAVAARLGLTVKPVAQWLIS